MTIKIRFLIFFLFTLSIFYACGNMHDQDSLFYKIRKQKFVDTDGRQIIFHGINVVNKNKEWNYLGKEGLKDFAAMRDWGFNCIRLGIIWDGVEPEPGVYDDKYLAGIDQRIAWAKENGLAVILDMHQDLYSVKYADGAPAWATLNEGKPHIADSPDWSDAYFSSPAVQTAWDNFWKNASAADGIGIQEHYARAWGHVAARYAKNTTVIGYDLMNEPFPGSEAAQIFPMMLQEGAKILSLADSVPPPSLEKIVRQWTDPDGRFAIMQRLNNIDIYSRIVDVPESVFAVFDKQKLMPMYRRVAGAIRQVDKNHILFLETTMGSNMGIRSHIEPLVNENGKRDPLQAYAPHAYDLVTDTRNVASASTNRVNFIFQRHAETAQRLGMPMLVGEWGAYGFHKGTGAAAQAVTRQLEKYLCSDTYWDYGKGIERSDHFDALNRPYPQKIAGTLIRYRFDPEKHIFKCKWREQKNISSPTLIYFPAWFSLDKKTVQLLPFKKGFQIDPPGNGSKSTMIRVAPSGESIERSLVVKMQDSD